MIAAVLLAAGSGRRLGLPKAFLDLDGRSAVELCLQALLEGGAERVAVVLPPGGAALVRSRGHAVQCLENPAPERGQTSTLLLGLGALGGGDLALLVHAVDHPLAGSQDVAALLAVWRSTRALIVAPSVRGRRGHPTLFDAAVVPELRALPPGEPAHAVVRRDPGRVRHVERTNPWLVRDVDDAAGLRAARDWLSRPAAPARGS